MVTDEELVRKARGGDRDAFGELIERHQRAVAGFLVSILRDLDSAEEVAQEAFVKAFARLDSFQERANFKTWVTTIALNKARSLLRWRKIRGWISLEGLGRAEERHWEETLREASGPSQCEHEALERRLELERAMQALSPREHEITALRVEGYSLGEIAGALGISTGTVKSTLFSATSKLRKELS